MGTVTLFFITPLVFFYFQRVYDLSLLSWSFVVTWCLFLVSLFVIAAVVRLSVVVLVSSSSLRVSSWLVHLWLSDIWEVKTAILCPQAVSLGLFSNASMYL